MRFRPDGGMQSHPNSPKVERASQEARAAAQSGESESVFHTRRHEP